VARPFRSRKSAPNFIWLPCLNRAELMCFFTVSGLGILTPVSIILITAWKIRQFMTNRLLRLLFQLRAEALSSTFTLCNMQSKSQISRIKSNYTTLRGRCSGVAVSSLSRPPPFAFNLLKHLRAQCTSYQPPEENRSRTRYIKRHMILQRETWLRWSLISRSWMD
jgi:hypothetical protein